MRPMRPLYLNAIPHLVFPDGQSIIRARRMSLKEALGALPKAGCHSIRHPATLQALTKLGLISEDTEYIPMVERDDLIKYAEAGLLYAFVPNKPIPRGQEVALGPDDIDVIHIIELMV